MKTQFKRLLSYREASAYLGISVSNLKRLIKRGELPVIKVGRRTLLDIYDLDEYIEKRRVRYEAKAQRNGTYS